MTKSIAYNINCMELMAGCPDKFFDLAIVDPPYGKMPMRDAGKNFGVAKRRFESGSDAWDIRPNASYFEELFRVSKHQIIWGGNYFIDFLTPTNCFIVWDKNKTFDAYSDCELAWTSLNLPARLFKHTWNGMLQENMRQKEERIHPTQKPIALYAWLLQKYAKQGDKILDTHLGSGSSRIAAYKLGFDFYACEINKEYFEAQERRFNEECKGEVVKSGKIYKQASLF